MGWEKCEYGKFTASHLLYWVESANNVMLRFGKARLGMARRGMARRGAVGQGMAKIPSRVPW